MATISWVCVVEEFPVIYPQRVYFNCPSSRLVIPTHRLNADEYAQLMGNFVEVVETHEDLLINIGVRKMNSH